MAGAGKGKKGKKGKKGAKGAKAAALAALEEQESAEAGAAVGSDLRATDEVGAASEPALDVVTAAASEASGEALAEEEEAAPPAETEVAEPETLEEQIRKTRPPSRVRITESAQPGYVSLRLEKIGIVFRNQEVIKDATWDVKTGDRVGLVGPNGGGKTTQLKILNGDIVPTTGEVTKSSKDLRVAFLKQEFIDDLVLDRTLKMEFMSVFEKELRVQEELDACEKELETVVDDPEKMQEVLDRLEDLNERARQLNIDALEAKVDKILNTVGFTKADGGALVKSFSGGWKMRIGLGKILLGDPNLLLLDEPTNHLDMESVEWLEDFLRNQNIPMVIVSHDREFLDRVCNRIVDCDGGTTYAYEGNYSRFLKLKKQRLDSWKASYDAQQKKIRAEKDWINRFRAGSNAAQAKSRERALEKLLASDEYVERPPAQGRKLNFRFPTPPRCSDEIAVLEDVSHGYNGTMLFEDVNIIIDNGDKIAIVGPNGAGKSTLARLLLGREAPLKGTAGITAHNAVVNYFEQNQADALDLDQTVLDAVMEDATAEHSYETVRALLGQFLFKGDSVEKKISNLSGGEKARVALCKFMLKPANVLVLDEPTNHLDIPAKEVLEEALQLFPGTVFMISHDRYFISKVATGICAIENKELVPYPGDYRSYMEQNDDLKDKIESRYITGDRRIEPVEKVEVIVEDDAQMKKKKKNFGGRAPGVSGRKEKGVKNAKRFN
uniref:ABC transporter domain-containing protein n=1 Tax=Pinguiococcus pyrenoidosus TaxID=172671 RepID=A0A7R9UFD2_9STRA